MSIIKKPQVNRGFSVSNLEAAVLLLHLHAAAHLPDEVGFEDANHSIAKLTRQLCLHHTYIDRRFLESVLWSSNLMDEIGLFWHPNGDTFEEFLDRLVNKNKNRYERNIYFDRFYNLFRNKLDDKEGSNV